MTYLNKTLLAGILLIGIHFAQAITINDYQRVFYPGFDQKGQLEIAIRYFYQDKVPYLLIVNPYTFETNSVPAFDLSPHKNGKPWYITWKELSKTPYLQALYKYTSGDAQNVNGGITHSLYSKKQVFLTIDMCPSSKGFEEDFFKALVKKGERENNSIPIAISVSGLWILGHPKEFSWFMTEGEKKQLNITWINHSFSHVYYPDIPSQDNFLLLPSTNSTLEILGTEKLLLEAGQKPSVFFRFPGLISNNDWMNRLRTFGLIPIGSDAWLAKNQKPKGGSIILVHGNSNEHKGIEMIMELLKEQPNLKFLPLSDLFN